MLYKKAICFHKWSTGIVSIPLAEADGPQGGPGRACAAPGASVVARSSTRAGTVEPPWADASGHVSPRKQSLALVLRGRWPQAASSNLPAHLRLWRS